MPFSEKQREYLRGATHRWNFKTGATRSGKTFLDYSAVIPKRMAACRGGGLVVLMGHSRGSIERNVLAPMRALWPGHVGMIRPGGEVRVFGKTCHALGAEKQSAVARLQGAGIAYCYGDEVANWNREVFEMLKSRLDAPNARFDGTCNPAHPGHWLKKFLDSDADIFHQSYTIDDNPYLSAEFVANLKREYAGTVYYERFIRGRWVRAEGAIYTLFADEPAAFLTEKPVYDFIQAGVDFGGNKSAFAFVACGLTHDYSRLTALCSERHAAAGIDPERMYLLLRGFLDRVEKRYGAVRMLYPDSAEQTLINGMRERLEVPVYRSGSIKRPIIDRIRATLALMGGGRFFYTKDCETLRDALQSAVYDERKLNDTRLDDGSCDIDTLDAFEYSWERFLRGYAMYGG